MVERGGEPSGSVVGVGLSALRLEDVLIPPENREKRIMGKIIRPLIIYKRATSIFENEREVCFFKRCPCST